MSLLRLFYQALMWLFLAPLVRRAVSGKRSPPDSFVSAWMMAAMTTTLFGMLSALGVAWAVPLWAAGMVGIMPWTVARAVFIPLGMSRCARWLSGLSGWTWAADRRGGALVAGAWAILRQRRPDRRRVAELERLRDTGSPLTGAKVLATGLLAAARGDLASARMLMESVEEIGVQTTGNTVHALAREWLVVHAAEGGEWQEVVRLAGGERARTRLTLLIGQVAARLTDQPNAPSSAYLWILWLLAGKRRHTFAVVREAAAVPVRESGAAVPPGRRLGTALEPDFYHDALSAHVYALASDAARLGRDDIVRLASIWDQALASPATHLLVARRAHALGARNAEDALRTLADEVSRDLANLARAANVAIAECANQSRVLADAQLWLRNDLIADVELAFDALQARIMDRRSLTAIDEWREHLSLRDAYVRAAGLGGLGLRRLAFPHVHHTVCKLAVWLWNERRELAMANAMFRWLLDEARRVGDAEAIELQTRNWDRNL